MRVLPLAPFASLLLSFAQTAAVPATPSTPARPAAPAQDSSAAGTAEYQNEALHLTYRYPSSYTDASAVVGPAFQASLSADPTAVAAGTKCLTLPFSRSNLRAGEIAFVLLVRADAGCLKRKFDAASLPEFTEGEAQGLAAAGARPAFGKAVSFGTVKHPATLVRGSFVLPTGQSLDAMTVCVLTRPDVACWQFLAATPESLTAMSAFPVSFDGEPAQPLVPAILAARP